MDMRMGFHHSLEELRKDILLMGEEAARLIRQAVEALVRMDADLADRTIAEDDAIDGTMLVIEERCLRLIALQQPMGGDLRLIGMAMKMATDLERVADHAVDIAKIVRRMSGTPPLKWLANVQQMADIATAMLQESLQAYEKSDVRQAMAAAEQESEVDTLYSSFFFEAAGSMGTDEAANRQLVHLLMAAHFLERVADHATNIGEEVIYMKTGHRRDLNV